MSFPLCCLNSCNHHDIGVDKLLHLKLGAQWFDYLNSRRSVNSAVNARTYSPTAINSQGAVSFMELNSNYYFTSCTGKQLIDPYHDPSSVGDEFRNFAA